MEKNVPTQEIPLFKRLEKQHPFLIMLYLAMTGSGVVFLFLLVGFTKSLEKFDLSSLVFPKFFFVSTILILVSSYFAQKAWIDFHIDEAKSLSKNLFYLIIIGAAFSICQILGWQSLMSQGIKFSGRAAGSYMYILTGLHILHLLAGLIFAIVQFNYYKKASEDAVQALIIFSNKYEKMKMRLLKDYWHFLDGLWIIIFLYLLFFFSL